MGLALFLLACLAIAWLGGVLTVLRILTHPPRRTYASAVARNRAGDPGELNPPRPFEAWSFTSRGLSLPVWDLPGDNTSGPIVILSHGWGDSRIGALQRLPLVLPSASRLIAWDMPGHGEAPGPCSLGTHEVTDLLALIEHLREPDRPIVLLGWSLGAGVSIAAAVSASTAGEPPTEAGSAIQDGSGTDPNGDSRQRPSPRIVGVVAEAPYRLPRTPAHNMLGVLRWPRAGLLAPALLLASLCAAPLRRRASFDRAALARVLPCPLLILHGQLDEICPIQDARDIAAAAALAQPASRLETLPDAYHNDMWQNEHRLARGEAAVRVFVASVA